MKTKIWIVLLAFTMVACKNADLEKLTKEKDQFYDNLQELKFDYKDAMQLAESYRQFFQRHPKNKEIPDLTMELADLTNNYLNEPKEAISHYSRVIEEYSKYEEVPVAIFMIATIYHDKLKDYEKSKIYYEKLINEYPDHYFVKDAKIMLDNLGKSPEELLDEILKKKREREEKLKQEKEG